MIVNCTSVCHEGGEKLSPLEIELTGFACCIESQMTKKGSRIDLPFSEMREDLKRNRFGCGYREGPKLSFACFLGTATRP